MAQSNVRQVGDRIESLLSELRRSAAPADTAKVEEVVGLLVELYGAGLERVLEIIHEDPPTAGPIMHRLAGDKFVESLLILHGLHPVDVDTRIQGALETVRPYLGSHAGGVEYLGVDENGVAHLKLEGSCHGCPSSTVTVKLTIEQAITEVAPEVVRVQVEGAVEAPTGPSLLQIQVPGGSKTGSNGNGAVPESAWTPVDAIGLLPGEKRVQKVGSMDVVVCSAVGNLYAYRNACAQCGGSLHDAALWDEMMRCSSCGTRYNVRLAGRSIVLDDGPTLYLDPLPLLQDESGWKVAVPAGARA